ncbi:chemotaxis protein CheW [Ostreibacterium oceani]|uniref:CheW-like domain-containing protein n=1 Tax=Ostreibacterium oceani TaxID=2654998 RepID=A0A6N7ES98_9GAMM|nr:chemotaxis protein CheW [Ostreibacterium oceani]MPV85372.1 hypothetical protein [Ostreibacterium oceani]
MPKTKQSFQYLARLAAHKKRDERLVDGVGQQTFLCTLVQGKKLHIPIHEVKEIIPKPKPVKIGHTKQWFEGLIKVQGDIYSAVNIGKLIYQSTTTEKNTFAVALSQRDGNYALLVHNVLGIIQTGSLEKISTSEYLDTYQTTDAQEIDILPIQQLIESTEFTHVSVF